MVKRVLDATCGGRAMWFNKDNPDALFTDIRTESHTLCDGRSLEITPDTEVDYTDMPFDDESFYLVVFDPPHLKQLGKTSWMAKKYGVLSGDWRTEIRKGFDECYRVLKTNGTLIFKWNEFQIPISEIIKVLGKDPLFGHTTRHSKTIWMTFLK